MNLHEKLRRLTRAVEPSPRVVDAPPTVVAPPAEPVREAFLRKRTVLPLSHAHGARRLAEVAALDPCELARLGDASWPVPGRASAATPCAASRDASASSLTIGPSGAPVFFDTETTSLASGAGVYVFLVGFARIEGDAFVAEQLYLEDPSREAEMLHAAAEWITAAPLLVSFSGRGFDERRLEDRFRFLRLASPFRRGAHADLCPLARSLWKARLPSCALSALERAHLGVARLHDLPGEQCPEAYFRSLRGDRAAAESILAHNLADLLSTATLAVHALERGRMSCDPAELLGLGLHAFRRRREGEALSHLLRAEAEEARAPSLRPDERVRLLLEAATLLRRAGREGEALRRHQALAAARPPSIDALIAIAKHAEHEARDLELARRASTEALAQVRRPAVRLTAARRRTLEADLVHRLARLGGKDATPRAAELFA